MNLFFFDIFSKMFVINKTFIIIMLSILQLSKCNNRIVDIEDEYIQNLDSENRICHYPKELQLAICKTIINEKIRDKEDIELFFNKAAAFHFAPICKEKEIFFTEKKEYNDKQVKQLLLPCYGRHDPIKTDWYQDEYLEFIYISDGINKDDIFIHLRKNDPKFIDKAEVFEVVYKYRIENIENLSGINITKEEMEEDLKSLQLMTFEIDERVIETNFVRSVILNNDNQTHLLTPIIDLTKEEKLALCKMLFSRTMYKSVFDFSLNEKPFDILSAHPIENEITFKIFEQYNGKGIKVNMFPCYGKPGKSNNKDLRYLNLVYIAGGYKKNSVIVLLNQQDDIIINEFIENINFSLLEEIMNGDIDCQDIPQEDLDDLFNQIEQLSDDEKTSIQHAAKLFPSSDDERNKKQVVGIEEKEAEPPSGSDKVKGETVPCSSAITVEEETAPNTDQTGTTDENKNEQSKEIKHEKTSKKSKLLAKVFPPSWKSKLTKKLSKVIKRSEKKKDKENI